MPSADDIIMNGKKAQKQFRDDILAGLSLGEIKVVSDKEDGTVFFVKFH